MNLSFFSLSPKALIGIALLLIGIPVTVFLVSRQQNLQQQAWSTDQSVSAVCEASTGKVVLDVRFTNTEPNGASRAMNVKVKDTQTGIEIDLGTVNPGETKRGNINTNQTSIGNGDVTFLLSWTDGHGGTDSRKSTYGSVSGCGGSNPTPTLPDFPPCPPDTVSGWAECRYGQSTYNLNACRSRAETYKGISGPASGNDSAWFSWAQTPPKPLSCGTACGLAPSYCIVDNSPTPVPSNTKIPPTLTPIPSSTPKPSISPTPTDIPPTDVLPSPTGPVTGCPVPKIPDNGLNIRIECPFCGD